MISCDPLTRDSSSGLDQYLVTLPAGFGPLIIFYVYQDVPEVLSWSVHTRLNRHRSPPRSNPCVHLFNAGVVIAVTCVWPIMSQPLLTTL